MTKLTVLLTLIGLTVSASTFSQRVTLHGKQISAKKLFETINNQTGYSFVFDNALLKTMPLFDLEETNTPLEDFLKRSLKANGFDYEIKRNIIVVRANPTSSSKSTMSQHRRITGQVLDHKGQPLKGANVKIIGNGTLVTLTDENGVFGFDLRNDDKAIVVNYLGYKENKIDLVKDKNQYTIKLSLQTNELEGVIVTGIFDKPKESFTGSARTISKEEIKMNGNRNLLKTLGNIDPSFDIRELNDYGSDPNRLPDIEIRGTATIGDINNLQNNIRNTMNLPLFILDGFEVTLERVMDMNQADVEEVVILKDASAKAIYGSRGANGVVVITSIRPEAGTLRINYSAGVNLELPDLSSYNFLNASQKLRMEEIANFYSDPTDFQTHLQLQEEYQKNLRAVASGVNTNWLEIPVQTGIGQYHKVEVMGGEDKFRYIVNGSYNQLKGAMKGSKRDNFNGGITFNYVGEKLSFSNNLTVGLNDASNSMYGSFNQYANMNPYWSPLDEEGKPTRLFGTKGFANPLLDAFSSSFNTNSYTNIRNFTSLDWRILNELRFTATLGLTQQKKESDVFYSPNGARYVNTTNIEDKGSYRKGNDKMNSYQVGGTLNYGKLFGLHGIYAGLNVQLMENKTYNTQFSAMGFLNENLIDISNALRYDGSRPSSYEAKTRSIGITGSLNYNYDNRYFADVSYRQDGASSFGSYSRWAPFWSLGGGWTVSNEKFFKENINIVNNLRFRYTYGVTGSMNFLPFQALTTYTFPNDQTYNYLNGAIIEALGNPYLKWQNTYEHNGGMDLSMFQSALNLTLNYYYKNTTNLVSDAMLPLSHGYDSYKENFGTIRNVGWDSNLSYAVIRKPEQGIHWALTAGLYNNKNTLVKLSDAIKEANKRYSGQHYSNGTIDEYREGQSIDEIYVLNSPGVDPITGQVLFMNSNGEVSTNVANMDKIAMGSALPRINGRFGTNLRWKGFSATVNFAVRLGGRKLHGTFLNRVENANIQYNMDVRVIDSRWQKPGDITAFKDIASQENTHPNNRFVFKENTVTLNNINVFYDIPERALKSMKLKRLSIGATMSDVFYWSNIEQERGLAYPYSFKPSFYLNATF